MLISIIIPVFNSAKYLRRCIESVKKQSYSRWELILVNDGSTDESGSICEEFSKSDSRIRVLHKSNGGVSSARNLGLNYISGDWVTFIDSDDEMLQYALESYVRVIEHDIDIIRGGFERVKSNRTFAISCNNIKSHIKEEIIRLCDQTRYETYLWNSCFRVKILKNVRFREDISWCEDHLFTFSAIACAQNVIFISNLVYRYYAPEINYNSFGNNLSSRFIEPRMIIKEALEEKTIKMSFIQSDTQEIFNIIKKDFYYKVRMAIRYSIIDNRFLEALMIANKYLKNNYIQVCVDILHFKIIPFIKKIKNGFSYERN